MGESGHQGGHHTPYYTPDLVFDGVEFDELTDQDPKRSQINRFYQQLHNRGWQNATNNLRVRAFLADASAGLPALPNALTPPDFNLTSTLHWTPIGPVQSVGVLEPNRPVIVSWDYVEPAGSDPERQIDLHLQLMCQRLGIGAISDHFAHDRGNSGTARALSGAQDSPR